MYFHTFDLFLYQYSVIKINFAIDLEYKGVSQWSKKIIIRTPLCTVGKSGKSCFSLTDMFQGFLGFAKNFILIVIYHAEMTAHRVACLPITVLPQLSHLLSPTWKVCRLPLHKNETQFFILSKNIRSYRNISYVSNVLLSSPVRIHLHLVSSVSLYRTWYGKTESLTVTNCLKGKER